MLTNTYIYIFVTRSPPMNRQTLLGLGKDDDVCCMFIFTTYFTILNFLFFAYVYRTKSSFLLVVHGLCFFLNFQVHNLYFRITPVTSHPSS